MTRKTIFSLLLVILGGFTVLLLLTKVTSSYVKILINKKQVGRTRAEHDPFLDPLNNPQIHNADVAVDAAED